MTPNPIRKVLSSMQTNGVRCLLIGGQACVLYGGAEFSRDIDLVLPSDEENLRKLQAALAELRAGRIAVPPFEKLHLDEGLAVHFRCQHADAMDLRIDVMSKLRGVDDFDRLWPRRTTFDSEGVFIEALGLPDLVASKKTQRDKDWSMIRRLMEAHYQDYRNEPSLARRNFWLKELRTPSILMELARTFPDLCKELAAQRPVLYGALNQDEHEIEDGLHAEEIIERQADRRYWDPLKNILENLRHSRPKD